MKIRPAAIIVCSACLAAACSDEPDEPIRVETLVPGSALHSPNGLTFGPDGMLYAGSVGAQTIYRIDVTTGEIEVVVAAPDGEADDIAFSPDGRMFWTALIAGEIRTLQEDGTVAPVVTGQPLINPLDFASDGRLFAGQIGIDRLYEFYLDGSREPRLIASKIGNLNSFEISDDGVLYGPLFKIGTVAQIDIETGAVTPIAEELDQVVAVNLDSKGNVWAIDWASGGLWRISRDSGRWRRPVLVASLEPPLDNLAIGPDDAVYVSRPAHSAIDRIDPTTGEIQSLVSGRLASPGGLAAITYKGRDALLVADGYGYRVVDTQTGEVSTTFDITEFGFPGAATAAAANSRFFALTDAVTRSRVYLVDRIDGRTVRNWTGIDTPVGIVLKANGDLVVADFTTGTLIGLTLADRKQRDVLVEDLEGPAGLAWAGEDAVYLTEALAGRLELINLEDGTRITVVRGLEQPEGVAVLADRRVAIVEVGKQRLIAVDPASGTIEVLAENLPVGEIAANAPAPVYLPTGVAQGADGSIYVSGDRDNSILKIVVPR